MGFWSEHLMRSARDRLRRQALPRKASSNVDWSQIVFLGMTGIITILFLWVVVLVMFMTAELVF